MLTDIDKKFTVNGETDYAKVCDVYKAIKLLCGNKETIGDIDPHHYTNGDEMMFFYSTADYRKASQLGWDAVAAMPEEDRKYPACVLRAYIDAVDKYLYDNTYTEDPLQYEPEIYPLYKMKRE